MLDACEHARDRLLVMLCWRCGLRLGEALGLHRADMHLLPDSTSFGCRHRGAHVHVVRREDNANGAAAKSRRARVVPVVDDVVAAYRDHQWERHRVARATSNELVFVNLFAEPIGTGVKARTAEELFERLSARVGRRVRPHMLRHSFASNLTAAGVPLDVVRELLGHASILSTQVYVHPDWDAMVTAVERLSSRFVDATR